MRLGKKLHIIISVSLSVDVGKVSQDRGAGKGELDANIALVR